MEELSRQVMYHRKRRAVRDCASAVIDAKALSQNNLSNFVYPVTFYTLGDIV